MNDSLPFNFCTTSSADSLTFSYRTTLSIVCTYVHVPDVIPNKKFLYHWPCGKLVSLTEKRRRSLSRNWKIGYLETEHYIYSERKIWRKSAFLEWLYGCCWDECVCSFRFLLSTTHKIIFSAIKYVHISYWWWYHFDEVLRFFVCSASEQAAVEFCQKVLQIYKKRSSTRYESNGQ